MNKLTQMLKALVNSFTKYATTYETLSQTPGIGLRSNPQSVKNAPISVKAKNPRIPVKKNTCELKLDRVWYSGKSTVGKLYVNGQFQCYILEDRVRNEKVYGETAIPEGRYEIVITYSPRFKTPLPLLKNVPGFKGIRIHPGNTHKDTEGCLLPGETRDTDFVGRSRRAFNALFKKLKEAKGKKIWITVLG